MRYILAAILLAFAALVLQLNLLAYAMLIVLVLLFVSRTITRRWTSQPQANRIVSKQKAEIGEIVEVNLEIHNRGAGTILWMLVEELLPNLGLGTESPAAQIAGDRLGVFRLPGGKTRHWRYELLFAKRGYFQLGPAVMETGDMLGLNRRFATLAEPNYILVLPKVINLIGYDIHSRRPIGEVVLAHRLFEDPTRINGVREYQPGDPLSRINWRATARTGNLQSKVYEPSCLAGATFVLDFHRDSWPGLQESVRSELAITAIASLANLLFEMGQQIGLMTNGRDALDRIQFEGWQGDSRTRDEARSKADVRTTSDRLRPVQLRTTKAPDRMARMLETLARLEVTDGLKFSELLLEYACDLPRDATVIAVVERVTLEIAASLANLRRQGFAVSALVNSPDSEHFLVAAGPLLAQGITPRQLKDELSISEICRSQAFANR